MKQLSFLWLAFGLMLLAFPVFAQQEGEFKQLLQEFNFTQAVYPQEKGELQFTAAGFLLQTKNVRDFDLGFSTEYGLTDRLQVEAEFVDIVVIPRNIDEAGQSNYRINTGLQYTLTNRPGFSSSLAMELNFPVHKVKEDSVSLEYEPHFILAKQIGKGQLHVDIGAEFQTKETEYFYNLAFVFPIGDLKPVMELNGSYEDDSEIFISPGLVWNGYKSLEVVTGTTFGLGNNSVPWGISLKLIYEFSPFRKTEKLD
jgi:hypothetical protein